VYIFPQILTLYLLSFSALFAISANDFINTQKCDQIIDKVFYTICYNYTLKSATAVSYTLEGDLVDEGNIQDRPNFNVEILLDEAYRISDSDYTNSGYNRGHLAPDAGFDWSEESLKSTYSLANIIPQVPNINQRTWSKAEDYARLIAVRRNTVNVLNIIRYTQNPLRIGKNAMAVSSGYYKVLYSDDQSYKECFYYQNDESAYKVDDALQDHLISCNDLYPKQEMDYAFLIAIIAHLSVK